MVIQTKEQLEQIIKNQGGDSAERYNRLKNRGIDFTVTQMHLMFIPRVYGKTFMSMCDVMEKGCHYDEYEVGFSDTIRGTRKEIPVIVPNDRDVKHMHQRRDYLDDLEKFAKEYFREYKPHRISQHILCFNRKTYI